MPRYNYKQMTRILLSLISLFFIVSQTIGQVYNPVKWSYDQKLIGNNQAELFFTAKIDDHWHVYANKLESDLGPIPTTFDFMEVKGAKLVGDIKQPKPIKKYDPNFDMTLEWFDHQVTFSQVIEFTEKKASITGELTYMTCDDSKCLPPEYLEFTFELDQPEQSAEKPKQTAPIKKAENADNVSTDIDEPDHASESTALAGDEPQIFDPVKWNFEVIEKSEGIYTLKATASIEEHWHVYSITPIEESGPIATELNFLEGDFELIGEKREVGTLKEEYDPNFMMDLKYFESNMVIEQDFKLTGNQPVKVEVYYMTCDAKRCLPPEAVEFIFKGDEPKNTEAGASLESTENGDEDDSENGSLWGIFLVGFLGGFAALLTPCVFPMIPMTVSFFTKQSENKAVGIRNAVIYGLSIIGIYTFLGFLVTITFGADALNALSTNVWFNLAFFVLLIVFAISFLGAFEITLPSSFVNKVDQQSYKGGLIGIFFMAFALSLVSFSCTGPIIGTLLVEAAVHGGIAGPLVGMGAFSLALALPFGLFAAFPGWMNTLPKSGGWLNSVKVVLGFLEIGLAFKFLSNADLVVQAGLLKRELFIAIWIAVSAMLTLYLLGFIRMPHDSPLEKLSVGRSLFGTAFLAFTIYLIPGLWGAPLKLISGFPPPMFYSESPGGLATGADVAITHSSGTNGAIPEGADPSHCPHGLNCFHDYEMGMKYAKEVNKPVLLDFTGWACVNCRKMEETVWSDPRVLDILNNEVVLISLYVDEKTELPKEEQYVSEETGKKIKTVGNKWADFQIKHFKSNSQPQYVIINHEEIKALNGTTAYDPDIELYLDWLNTGIETFEKQ